MVGLTNASKTHWVISRRLLQAGPAVEVARTKLISSTLWVVVVRAPRVRSRCSRKGISAEKEVREKIRPSRNVQPAGPPVDQLKAAVAVNNQARVVEASREKAAPMKVRSREVRPERVVPDPEQVEALNNRIGMWVA